MIKLYNANCLEKLRDLKSDSVDFTLTDIPYNVVNRKSHGLRSLNKRKADILTFEITVFLDEIYRITKNSVCIFCSKEQFSTIYSYFSSKKGTVRPIVWQKSNPSPMNGKYIYLSGVELAVWFKKSGGKVFNAYCKNTVFKYSNGNSKIHPTAKNLKLFKELILDNSNENDLILDPCMGSGTTGMACLDLKRNFIGIEIDKEYFEIAKSRIDNHSKSIGDING